MTAPTCAAILARLEPLRPVLEAMRDRQPWRLSLAQLDAALDAMGVSKVPSDAKPAGYETLENVR